MKWQSHKTMTFFTTLLLTGNPIFAVISLPGSIFPDVLDLLANLKHRTYSHVLAMWLFFTLSFLMLASQTQTYSYLSYFTIKNFLVQGYEKLIFTADVLNTHSSENVVAGMLTFFAWFSFGAFMHCLEDTLTGGVPFINPSRKTVRFKFFRTGSVKECLFCFSYVVVCIILIYFFQVK